MGLFGTQVWLANALNSEITVLDFLGSGVNNLAWKSDSLSVAVARESGDVEVLTIENEEVIKIGEHLDGAAHYVSWSPNGLYIASSGRDNTVRIWDVESKEMLLLLRHPSGNVTKVEWNPEGKLLASYQPSDNRVIIWEVDSGEQIAVLEDLNINDFAWAPNNNLLALACEDGKVRIWDVDKGEMLTIFDSHQGQQNSFNNIAWNSDGDRIAASGEVQVWILPLVAILPK